MSKEFVKVLFVSSHWWEQEQLSPLLNALCPTSFFRTPPHYRLPLPILHQEQLRPVPGLHVPEGKEKL